MKRDIRKILLKKRDGITPEEKKKKEAAIKKRLFASADFKKAKSILFYASFRSEVDTVPWIQHALKLKKVVVLPRVDREEKELSLCKIEDVSKLESGYLGIPEPKVTKGRKTGLKDIDVVIIPGAGFDIKGNRLGYGHGYYDKLLSKAKEHIMTIALAFEEQIVSKIPNEIHDVKVDKIITDKRVINCKNR